MVRDRAVPCPLPPPPAQPHDTLPKARSSVHPPTFRATRGDSAQGFVVTESLWGPPARPGATGRAQVRSLRHPSDSMLGPHTRGRHAGPCAAAGADPQETAPTPAEPTPPHASPCTPHGSQPPGPGGQVTGGNVTDSRRCRRPTLRPPGDSGPTTDAERGGTAGAPASCRAASHKEGPWGDPVFTHSVGYRASHPPTGPAPRLPELGAGRVPGRGRVSQADTWAARWMCFWREAGPCSQRAASRGQQLPDLGPTPEEAR